MNKKRKIFMFELVYFVIVFALIHLTGFLFDFSRSMGYSLGGAGSMFALMTAGTAAGQIVIGYISDKLHKTRDVVLGSLVVSIVFSILMIIFPYKPVMVISIFMIGFSANSLFVVMDTWVLNDEDATKDFSKILSASPFARIIAASGLGYLFVKVGYGLYSYTLTGALLLTLAVFYFIEDRTSTSENKPISIDVIKNLFSYKSYRTVVFMLFLIYLGVNTTIIFTSALIRDLGGTSLEIGVFSTISAIIEIAVFLMLNKVASRIKPQLILIMVNASVILHLVGLIVAKDYKFVYLLAFFNAFTFAAFLVGSKLLLNNAIPAAIIMTGQALGASIFLHISASVNSTFAGFAADKIGITNCLIAYVVFMALVTAYNIKMYNADLSIRGE